MKYEDIIDEVADAHDYVLQTIVKKTGTRIYKTKKFIMAFNTKMVTEKEVGLAVGNDDTDKLREFLVKKFSR